MVYLLYRAEDDPLLPDHAWVPMSVLRQFNSLPISALEIRVSDLATQEEDRLGSLSEVSRGGAGVVLVTGCMGRVGFWLIRRLLQRETDDSRNDFLSHTRVVCVDIFPWSLVVEGSRLDNLFAKSVGRGDPHPTLLQYFFSSSEGPEVTVANFKYFQGDIRNKALLDRIFNLGGDWQIRGIVHLASYSEVLPPSRAPFELIRFLLGVEMRVSASIL